MNKPNEHTLNLWLRGELEGEELRNVEAWAEVNASDLDSEFKCNIGWDALGADFMQAIPASEEPPYPEFFNSKIEQAIRADEAELSSEPVSAEPSLWQKLFSMVIPAAIAASIAFYAGSQMTQPASSDTGSKGIVAYEKIYVPDSDVAVAISETDRATEIVLEGLHPISDELDIVKGETSLGVPPTMMVIHPEQDSKFETDSTSHQVTFF